MRSRPLLALLAACLALGLALTLGVWTAPTSLLPATIFTDGNLFAAVLGGDGVTNGELWRLWTHRTGGPSGAMFRPLFWPTLLLAAALGPVLALNLTWALVPTLNALGTYALARTRGAAPVGAAFAGALVAWNPWVRTTLGEGQIEQAALGLVALVWAAASWAVAGAGTRVAAIPLVVVAVGLAVPNLGLAALCGLGALAACDVARGSPWRRWAVVLLLALPAALLVSAYHAPNFHEGIPNVFHPRRSGDDHLMSLATPWEFVAWPGGRDTFEFGVLHTVYLGLGATAAAGIALRRRDAWPLAATAGLLGVLALGSATRIAGLQVPLPLGLLQRIAPEVAESGSAYRFAAGVVVALAVAAGIGLAPAGSVGTPTGRRQALIAVWAAACWAETLLLPGRALPLAVQSAWHHPELAALSGGRGMVLDLPLHEEADVVCKLPRPPQNHYLNALGIHDRPLPYAELGHRLGRFHYGRASIDIGAVREALISSYCADLLPGALRGAGVGAVVLHPRSECPVLPAQARCLEAALGAPTALGDTWAWDGLPLGPSAD